MSSIKDDDFFRNLKRVKYKINESQNPLFESWLKEWKKEAAENGSDMQHCFNKALKSLKKFPIKLYSGKECMMLENFGTKICKMLDDRLNSYKAMHPEDLSVYPKHKERNSISGSDLDFFGEKTLKKKRNKEISPSKKKTDTDIENKKKTTKNLNYTPSFRSGPYAILIALLQKSLETNFKGFMTKAELQNEAQNFCDTSFTKPQPGCHYTAWSSMSVLIKKKLVNKLGNPAKFSLTEEGMDLALKLKLENSNHEINIEKPIDIQNGHSPAKYSPPKKLKKTETTKKSPDILEGNKPKLSPKKCLNVLSQPMEIAEADCVSEADETVFLLPGTFEIKLLVDTQERDNKFQQANNMTMKQLKFRNVNFEIRHLKVGDFIWIARDLNNGHELVLPYIVERKRMDDLASSIKDGRFHEQKFRLTHSGLENLIYLVEKYGHEGQRLGLPYPTLLQAISNTQIINNFTVKITNNHDDSMRYLDCMTTQLNNFFKDKTLMSCKKSDLPSTNFSDELVSLMTFKDFNRGSEKNKKSTVQSMLIKHLVQLSGVSVEKAIAIVQLYPTPKSLFEALKKPSGEKSIAELTVGGFNRSIGSVTAKQISMLYTSTVLK